MTSCPALSTGLLCCTFVCEVSSVPKISCILGLILTWTFRPDPKMHRQQAVDTTQTMARIDSALVTGRVVGMDQRRHIRFPIGFPMVFDSTQHIEQRFIKALWHSIANRVVGRGP